MILNNQTQVYMVNNDNSTPHFGEIHKTKDITYSYTTLGEIAARILSNVLDINNITISTELEVLTKQIELNKVKKLINDNSKTQFKIYMQEFEIRTLLDITKNNEIPWQSFDMN